MSLLNDGKLAKTIAAALAGVMYPVTLRRVTPGTYVPGTGSTPATTTDFPARGMFDSFSTEELAGGLVLPGDRRVTLLADGLAVTPTPATDSVVIGTKVLTVVAVTSDPAAATWTLQVR